jgi:CDP-diacylglycerol--glycerol-3-phosphate 3-phosphatidyltransferase
MSPWLNLPNALSVSRVAVLPFVVAALAGQNKPVLLALVAWVALSDFLDGLTARWLRQVSDLGKALDPAADKIGALVLSVALVVYTDFPVWAMALLWAKDVLIALGGWLVSRRERVPIMPNFWGKAAAMAEIIAFFVFAFDLRPLERDALWVMTGFVVVSFLSYAGIFAAVTRGRQRVADIVATYGSYGLPRGDGRRERRVRGLVLALCAGLLLRLVWLIAAHWSELKVLG